MLQYMPYVWAAITVVAVCIESATADLVTIWFIPAGIISFIVSLLPSGAPIWLQTLIFFATALLLLTSSKTIFKKLFQKKPLVATNLDAVVGMDAIVTETISNIDGTGEVKVAGKYWSAVSDDPDTVIEKNEVVTVRSIRGVKLVCIKK